MLVLCLMAVCALYSMNVQVIRELIFFLLVFNPMCMCFLCVKIANVLCCEKNVLYVVLIICGLLIFLCVCFWVFFLFVFCVCNHLWVIFYFCVLCLFIVHLLFIVWDECAILFNCDWCFMPLDYCCQIQECESKGVKDRTSWSQRGVAKNPQNWQKIFILMLQYLRYFLKFRYSYITKVTKTSM